MLQDVVDGATLAEDEDVEVEVGQTGTGPYGIPGNPGREFLYPCCK